MMRQLRWLIIKPDPLAYLNFYLCRIVFPLYLIKTKSVWLSVQPCTISGVSGFVNTQSWCERLGFSSKTHDWEPDGMMEDDHCLANSNLNLVSSFIVLKRGNQTVKMLWCRYTSQITKQNHGDKGWGILNPEFYLSVTDGKPASGYQYAMNEFLNPISQLIILILKQWNRNYAVIWMYRPMNQHNLGERLGSLSQNFPTNMQYDSKAASWWWPLC